MQGSSICIDDRNASLLLLISVDHFLYGILRSKELFFPRNICMPENALLRNTSPGAILPEPYLQKLSLLS